MRICSQHPVNTSSKGSSTREFLKCNFKMQNFPDRSSTASLEAYLSKYGVCPRFDSENQSAGPALERLKHLDEQLDVSMRRSPLFQLDGNPGRGVQPKGSLPAAPAAAAAPSTIKSMQSVTLYKQQNHLKQQQQQQQQQHTEPHAAPQGQMPCVETLQAGALTATERLRQEWEHLKSRHSSITRASGEQGQRWAGSQTSGSWSTAPELGQQTSTGRVLDILNNQVLQQSPCAASPTPLTPPNHNLGHYRGAATLQHPAAWPPPHGSTRTGAAAPGHVAAHVTSNATCSRPAGQLVLQAPCTLPVPLRVSTGVQTEESSFGGAGQPRAQQAQLMQQPLQGLQHGPALHPPLHPPPLQPVSTPDLRQAVQDALLAIMSQPPPQLIPILASMLQQQQQFLLVPAGAQAGGAWRWTSQQAAELQNHKSPSPQLAKPPLQQQQQQHRLGLQPSSPPAVQTPTLGSPSLPAATAAPLGPFNQAATLAATSPHLLQPTTPDLGCARHSAAGACCVWCSS